MTLPPIAFSPRLIAELVLVVLLVVFGGSTVTYRALYQSAKTQATTQLSNAAAVSAEETRKAWSSAYAEREAQMQRDRDAASQVAKDAVARAAKAEGALARMQRDRNAEAKDNPCLAAPLSERTRERLRQLETDHRAGTGPDVRARAGAR